MGRHTKRLSKAKQTEVSKEGLSTSFEGDLIRAFVEFCTELKVDTLEDLSAAMATEENAKKFEEKLRKTLETHYGEPKDQGVQQSDYGTRRFCYHFKHSLDTIERQEKQTIFTYLGGRVCDMFASLIIT